MPMWIEEFERPQENLGYVAYRVWLGKIWAGKVIGHWNSHTFTYPTRPPGYTYYASLDLPLPAKDGRLASSYPEYQDAKNKQEALDNLLAQVRQWIADAGLVPATEAREERDEQPTD
jgi:hypothetical protein